MARPRTIIINKDDLEELYLKKRLSLDFITKKFGCGERTIFDRLHEYKISIRYDRKRKDITEQKLKDLYFYKKLSIEEISKIFSCSKGTVWAKFRQYNIAARTKSQANKGKCRIIIPDETKFLYIDKGLAIKDIAKRFNCSSNTILKRLRSYGISTRKERIIVPKSELENTYIRDKMTIYQIGQKFSCNAVTILNRLNHYNIPIRKKGESNVGKYKVEIPVEEIKDLYIGRKIPISKIKKIFNCHAETIRKRLERCGIPIRSIGEALKGNPSSIRGKHHTEETRKKLSALTVKQLASGKMKRKDTVIEKKIEEGLMLNNIYYQKNVSLCGITVPDFYLPNYRLAIYADGDYWHNLQTARDRDERQNKILKLNGYQVLRFWEHEIKKSTVNCISKIKECINF